MNFDLFLDKMWMYIQRFLSNGWMCIGAAIVVLFFAIFSMNDRDSSAGSWFWIVLCVILVLIGLSDITGLGLMDTIFFNPH